MKLLQERNGVESETSQRTALPVTKFMKWRAFVMVSTFANTEDTSKPALKGEYEIGITRDTSQPSIRRGEERL